MKKTGRNLAGKTLLFAVFLIAALFLLFGLSLTFVGAHNFITASQFSPINLLYMVIGAYIAFASFARFLKFYNAYNWDSYEKSSKFFITHSLAILITLLSFSLLYFVFTKKQVSEFNFILSVILYLPEFVFQNLIFAVKSYSIETFRPLPAYSAFDFLLPIAEMIYLFFIVSHAIELFKKFRKAA
ncbi:MAG TPA: hypothetical protein VI564_03205 [Candidatus Nanoarchaeia archaeon]|nr:hypothetical protein [Candidatus Nanoarchaeia archaeon]